MPRYFFHLHNDIDVEDDEGKEFTHIEAALAYATTLARFEFAEHAKRQGRVVLSHRIDVEDEQGRVLDSVQFGDVVKVEN